MLQGNGMYVKKTGENTKNRYLQMAPKAEEVSRKLTPFKEDLQTKAPANARPYVYSSIPTLTKRSTSCSSFSCPHL